MNVLIVGCGAREHAIAQALHRSVQKPQIFCIGAYLNPGIQQFTQKSMVGDISDCAFIVNQALDWEIDLAIIGPELPLEKGLADVFWEQGITVVGPKKKLAQLETSKEFARDLMNKYNIPGLPEYRKFKSMAGVEEYLHHLGEENFVIKANGLMAGKGVKVAGDHLQTIGDALLYCQQLLSRQQNFIIEEKLLGQEFSLMCFADGIRLLPMPLVQDHKRAYKEDKGPNTGGMGSYSAANHSLPFLQPQDVQTALAINNAVFQAVNNECQERYIGFLYGSFIATAKGIFVIEFNARLGDPEALNVLPILETDFLTLCMAMVTGQLNVTEARFAAKATVCKYAVPEGYPDKPLQNFIVDIADVCHQEQLYLGAVTTQDSRIIATGSRTAAYVGIAETISLAEKIAETEISRVQGHLYHREDIGTEKLIEQRIRHLQQLRAEY